MVSGTGGCGERPRAGGTKPSVPGPVPLWPGKGSHALFRLLGMNESDFLWSWEHTMYSVKRLLSTAFGHGDAGVHFLEIVLFH